MLNRKKENQETLNILIYTTLLIQIQTLTVTVDVTKSLSLSFGICIKNHQNTYERAWQIP